MGHTNRAEFAVALAVAAVAVWMAAESIALAVTAAALAALALWWTLRDSSRYQRLIPSALVFAGTVAAVTAVLEVRRVERAWPETRERLVEDARAVFQREVATAVARAVRLVERAAVFETDSRVVGFRAIDRAIDKGATDHGVVIMDVDGTPWAWGGVLRVPPRTFGPALAARITAFYVFLEARRQDERRSVVSQVVLAADSAVPDRDGTLAARFTAATGVGLVFRTSLPDSNVPAVVFCEDSCEPKGAMPVDTLLIAELVPPTQGAAKIDAQASGGRWTMGLCMLGLMAMIALGNLVGRWVGLLGIAALLMTTPAGGLLGFASGFSSASYYLATLGPLSASAGALLLAALLVVVILLQQMGGWKPFGTPGRVGAVVVIAAAPWVLSFLSTGISPLSTGTTTAQWLSWQVPLTVVGVALGLIAGKLWAPSVLPAWWVPVLGAVGGIGLAAWGVVSWQPFSGWPLWYAVAWVPVWFLAIQGVSRMRVVVSTTVVAGAAAAVLTWGAEVESRLLVAERDADRLSGGDPIAIAMLERFADDLGTGAVPRVSAALYAQWSRSPLAQDDYPAVLDSWDPFGQRIASLSLAELPIASTRRAQFASIARLSGEPVYDQLVLEQGVHYIAAIPFPDRSVVTVAVGPRSRLVPPVLVARFLRGERRIDTPYRLTLGERVSGFGSARIDWRRAGQTIGGTRTLDLTGRGRELNITVALRDLGDLGVRGVLIILLDGLVMLVIAGLSATVLFGMRLPAPVRQALQFRSYRIRLTIALAGFFVLPTLGFALWSLDRIRSEADRSRDILIQSPLRNAARIVQQNRDLGIRPIRLDLPALGAQLDADLFLYQGGVLTDVSAPILLELGLVNPFLPPDVYSDSELRAQPEWNANAVIGGRTTRVGYRTIDPSIRITPLLAAPQLVDAGGLQREREDLALGVLLVTLLGVAGAIGLAAFASRSLSKPVQSLRSAAIAVGRGERLPAFAPSVPTEFVPVVDAFVRMAHDIEISQAALEAARRRTATVLANVATGVVAVDRDLRITMANPRAAELLGSALPAGDTILDVSGVEWRPMWEWVVAFMAGGAEFEEAEFAIGERQIRARVAVMHTDPRGCVVALDDTTELSRAVRVLAWGELARQVAHEIKNPLTPIRLGIQHIQRARRDGSPEFDALLERTSHNILAEIERLDSIARAFARFGAPPAESAPLALNDLVSIAREAADLYAVADAPAIQVEVEGRTKVEAFVRRDEVKEVLINLIENSRDAGARFIVIGVERNGDEGATIRIRDDGTGITKEHMRRVFEPQFSATSSGTGLGLAICRRLVEGWGGSITVKSEVGEGTEVTITLNRKEATVGGGLIS